MASVYTNNGLQKINLAGKMIYYSVKGEYRRMSRKLKCFLISVVFGMFSFSCGYAVDIQQKLTVMKKGDVVYVRSYFSPENDIVISIIKGTNRQITFSNAGLLSSGSPFDDASIQSLVKFHTCGDDSTPWCLNGTYIGANHGCSDGLEIAVRNHGLSDNDIGSEWLDEAGRKFYILKIANQDKFWLLSENEGKDEIWKFNKTVQGKSLKNSSDGRFLKLEEVQMVQITPACRIKEQKYLVNGKEPLMDGKATPCEFLDIVEEYDIIAPDSLLDSARKNKGRPLNFIDGGLDSVVTNKITYRLLPMGACTVEHKSKANRKFNLSNMGFIQTAALTKGEEDSLSYYIPKTLPFETNGVRFDFKSVQGYPVKPPVPLSFSGGHKNIENPANQPDRIIQFLDKKENGKIGYAIGYSLTEGITVPEERLKNNRDSIYIHTTSKTYPSAVDSKMGVIPAGKEFHCLAYRQYFNPSAYKNATSVYWHKEADSYILYIDYHKAVDDDIIKFPDYLSGKKITVVEKTPSVKLLTEDKIPTDGLRLSVGKEAYGYIVLKLD